MKVDLRIKEDILKELDFEPNIDETDIGVIVKNGIVTLTGHVSNYTQKSAAERAAIRVKGVKTVVNKITLESPVKASEVKYQIKSALEHAARKDADNITVETKDHEVILTGEVHSWAEKEEAFRAAYKAPGVWTVKNKIIVTPYI